MSTATGSLDTHLDTHDEGTPAAQWSKDTFTNEELAELRKIDDVRAGFAVFMNFAILLGWFALVAIWPNPLTILLALFGIGARQLGFAVIMHEASHRSLFSNRALNDWAGDWLGAHPVWAEVAPYRRYHLVHHAHTGTLKDPDLSLSAPFPISRKSFLRKVWRDLSGQTGFKQAVLTAKRDLGLGQRKTQRTQGLAVGQKPDVGWHKLAPFVLWNLVLFGLCAAAGHPLVYLLWPIAFLTTYRLVLRIRAIGEHAMAGPADDPLRNTRTTIPSWWERLFIAPVGVNWHLEHHLVMTVPWYNLPRMHEMLKQRGLIDGRALIANGYVEVLRAATRGPVSPA